MFQSYVEGLADFLGCEAMAFFQLRAYCDESYANVTDDRHTIQPFLIGGYVGHVRLWRKVEREWTRLLRKENLPYFHATKCDGGYGIFAHLKDDQKGRERIQRLFYDVVNRYEIHGVAAGVPQEHFSRLHHALAPYRVPIQIPGKKKEQEMVTPYLFALEGCFHAAFALLKGHEEKQVGFVFDQEQVHEARAQIVRNQSATNPGYENAHRLGPLTYDSKQKAIPLQLADIVAYESMRALREPEQPRWQHGLLEKRRRIHTEYMDKEKVDLFLERMHAYIEEHGPPTL